VTVGDVLEWIAAVAFVAAAFIFAGLALALVVAGVALVYEAQCYSSALPPFRRRKPVEVE
jgi:hypothetical protein